MKFNSIPPVVTVYVTVTCSTFHDENLGQIRKRVLYMSVFSTFVRDFIQIYPFCMSEIRP